MSAADLRVEFERLSAQLDVQLEALRAAGNARAHAEHAYRKARAVAWAEHAHFDGLAHERDAKVDAETADKRRARDLAAAAERSGLEAVRSRRQQISALQTIANVEKAEADYGRTGPERTP